MKRAAPDSTLIDIPLQGTLDALISPRAPSATASKRTRRRLVDPQAEEIAYYRQRDILPIMHLLVIRRSAYMLHKSRLQELYRAFDTARHMEDERLVIPKHRLVCCRGWATFRSRSSTVSRHPLCCLACCACRIRKLARPLTSTYCNDFKPPAC